MACSFRGAMRPGGRAGKVQELPMRFSRVLACRRAGRVAPAALGVLAAALFAAATWAQTPPASTSPLATPLPRHRSRPSLRRGSGAGTGGCPSVAAPRDTSVGRDRRDVAARSVAVGHVRQRRHRREARDGRAALRLARHLDGLARQELGIVDGDAQGARGCSAAQRGALARARRTQRLGRSDETVAQLAAHRCARGAACRRIPIRKA